MHRQRPAERRLERRTDQRVRMLQQWIGRIDVDRANHRSRQAHVRTVTRRGHNLVEELADAFPGGTGTALEPGDVVGFQRDGDGPPWHRMNIR